MPDRPHARWFSAVCAWRFYLKGLGREATGRREMAVAAYRAALERAPEQAGWWYRLGRVQESMRQWRAAADSYHEAVGHGGERPRRAEAFRRVTAEAERYLIRDFRPLAGPAGRCGVCGQAGLSWEADYPADSPLFKPARIRFCRICGSGAVPDAARLVADYYRSDYAAGNRRDRELSPEEYFAPDTERRHPGLRHYFARARAQVDILKAAGADFGRVLDYGAGPGYFLYVSGAREPFAVELDSHSDKYLAYLGATKLDPDQLPRHHFDVVVASHVLEHLTAETVRDTMRRLVESLRPGGLLLVEVPNGGHLYLELTDAQEPHTLFFAAEGLRRLLYDAGAEVVSTYAVGPQHKRRSGAVMYAPPEDDAWASSGNDGIGLVVRGSPPNNHE